MGIRTRNIVNRQVTPEKLSDAVLRKRYFFDNFMTYPTSRVPGALATPSDGLPLGTSLTEIILDTGLHRFTYAFLGDSTDLFEPTLASDGGLNLATGQAVDLGMELNFGGILAGHPRNFIPEEEDWFIRALVAVDDWSGADVTLGFRNAAAYVATLSEAADFGGVRVLGDSSSALAAKSIVYVADNAGSTDYTSVAVSTGDVTDATALELEVQCVNQKLFCFINSVRVGTTADYTFDPDNANQTFMPVLRVLQTTDLAAQFKLFAVEGGPLAARRTETLFTLAGETV